MCVDLLHPFANIIVAILVCHIISKNYPHGVFVVGLCYCAEAFLSCSIPYLQFDLFSVHVYSLYFEIDSDCGQMRGGEVPFAKLKEDAGFTYS